MAEQPAASAAHNFKSVKDVEVGAKTRMEKSIADMQHTIAGIRTGRASVSVFDSIRVDYYGTPTPINDAPAPRDAARQPAPAPQDAAVTAARPIATSPKATTAAKIATFPRGKDAFEEEDLHF